jgi:hypothetical protein
MDDLFEKCEACERMLHACLCERCYHCERLFEKCYKAPCKWRRQDLVFEEIVREHVRLFEKRRYL